MKWHIEIEKEDSTKIGKLCSMKTGNLKWFKTEENALKRCSQLKREYPTGIFTPVRSDEDYE